MASSAAVPGNDPRSIVILCNDAEACTAFEAELSSLAHLNFVADADSAHLRLGSSLQQLLVVDLDSVSSNRDEVEAFATAIRARHPDVPVIVLTRSRSSARVARRLGLHAALVAPVDPDRLIEEVASVLSGSPSPSHAGRRSLAQLIGVSEPMQNVYDSILRLADSNTTVLIRGESGSGKELAARAIVSLGRRATKPFISLNCAALPETLIETELFGHERGAYTGADRARPGHIELAHTGTLFLDEIATLTLSLQSKLL